MNIQTLNRIQVAGGRKVMSAAHEMFV